MKIAFDARMINHPGIGRYIKNLLNAIAGLNAGYEFLLFGDKKQLTAYGLRLTAGKIIQWNAPVYSLREQFLRPFKRYKPDIIHVPHFNAPLTTGKGRGKVVVTIHDLIYTKFPEYLPLFKRGIARRLIINAAKKSDAIIAVSKNTKKDISELVPGSRFKTEVIYEASDPQFRVIEDKQYLKLVKERYSIPEGDILLFVGSLKKHKNVKGLLHAYEKVKRRVSCSLVIAGRFHKDEHDILKKITASGALYLGEVRAEDLAAVYNLATALVFPSFYEGFGLPLLEAFACGIPTIASYTSSLPEIAGGSSVYFNPCHEDDISDKIYSVLTDKELREDLVSKGFERTRQFSWQKTAEETLAVYDEVLIKA